jgi:hypothetical protein
MVLLQGNAKVGIDATRSIVTTARSQAGCREPCFWSIAIISEPMALVESDRVTAAQPRGVHTEFTRQTGKGLDAIKKLSSLHKALAGGMTSKHLAIAKAERAAR